MKVVQFLLVALLAGQAPEKEGRRVNEAQKRIEEFRQGVKFSGSAGALAASGKASDQDVRTLTEALRTEPADIREKVVKLLVELGRETDSLYNAGGRLIRDEAIVRGLIIEGLARVDAARDIALDALQWSVPGDVLRVMGGSLTEQLRARPNRTLLLVVAKAKSDRSREVVDALMEDSSWSKVVETRIAKAALGDQQIEGEFITAFQKEQKPEEKARQAKLLGFIGTQGALTALAQEVRTPLTIRMPGVLYRSVRLDIIAALSYNFPRLPFLWDNAIHDDSGYEKAERFCEETFGIKLTGPRPPYLTIRGLPSGPPE